MSNDHDGVDGDIRKVHCHGSPGAKQVGADLAQFETKFILPQDKGGCMQCSAYVCAPDTTDLAKGADKGVDSGVVGSLFVVAEALDKRCHLADWAHDVIVGAEKRDCLHAVAVLLIPERHQDKVGVMQGAVVMCDEGVIEKELDVSNADKFGAGVLPWGTLVY